MNKERGMFNSDRCSFCNDFGEKAKPFICTICLNMINDLINQDRTNNRKSITTGITNIFKGTCAWFKIGNQTFYLLEQVGEEGATPKEQAEWYEKMLNAAFDTLFELEETK